MMKKSLYIAAIVIGILILTIVPSLLERTSAQNEKSYQLVYVETGDSLWSLAKRYVPKDKEIREFIYEIRQLNDIEPSKLQPGELLKIPVS
ncbi:LysM peptidoglycan-binding domain-containing protein [Mahella sp.]|uniref:cell division suppressor protein YneA n=1 Tax=Mahella sp. TaxID=2798721 RepID=UPI0025BCB533|nr:LysM peptidoglycan-binding domain-containing protein [Mahella sp.]